MRDVNVLIITGATNVDCRQLPGGKPELVSGDRRYCFYVNRFDVEADIVVVRNKYLKKTTTFRIAPENSILMLSEPQSVVNFPKRYRDQFGMLYSCQPEISHRNVVYGPALLPWFVGVENRKGKSYYSRGYDEIVGDAKPEKSKLMCVITSSKTFTLGHQRRIEFVAKLKERYGDKLDVYGKGIRDFGDKMDVMAQYKYHIAIENTSTQHYWTEKLADCYLTDCYPIYYGCKNVAAYFPEGAFTQIDIDDFELACQRIDEVIASDAYGRSVAERERCKRLVADDYNMFRTIANCCDRLDVDAEKRAVTLKPSVTMLDWKNLYKYVIERNALAIRGYFVTKKSILKLKSVCLQKHNN